LSFISESSIGGSMAAHPQRVFNLLLDKLLQFYERHKSAEVLAVILLVVGVVDLVAEEVEVVDMVEVVVIDHATKLDFSINLMRAIAFSLSNAFAKIIFIDFLILSRKFEYQSSLPK